MSGVGISSGRGAISNVSASGVGRHHLSACAFERLAVEAVMRDLLPGWVVVELVAFIALALIGWAVIAWARRRLR